MSAMPRTGTGPEIALRRELHRRGLRFRVNVRGLPGTPDLAFTRAKIAVFVDGCFWHRCPDHSTVPVNNREWWSAKLNGNVQRDHRNDERLREMGWLPVHFWEHTPVATAADEVEALWRSIRRT